MITRIYFSGHVEVERIEGLGPVEGDDPLVLLHSEQNLGTLTDEKNPIKLEPIEFLLKNVTIHCLFELGHVESITEILRLMLQIILQVDQALLDCYLDRVLQTISAIFNRREEQSCKILLSCMVTYFFWPPRKKDKHKMQKSLFNFYYFISSKLWFFSCRFISIF